MHVSARPSSRLGALALRRFQKHDSCNGYEGCKGFFPLTVSWKMSGRE